MFMLGLKETRDQMVMASSVHWHVHVQMREGVHVLRRALDIEVESQRMKYWPMRIWKNQVEEESAKVGLRREDELCRSKWYFGVKQIAVLLR